MLLIISCNQVSVVVFVVFFLLSKDYGNIRLGEVCKFSSSIELDLLVFVSGNSWMSNSLIASMLAASVHHASNRDFE